MCGIFGYVGKGDVTEKTLKGLKKLEYRGYDSSGIAGIVDGKLVAFKEVGKVHHMESKVLAANPRFEVAIAQTRWATHGQPSYKNAHPHFNGKNTLALIHNGIIENHSSLRKMLEEKGVVFVSDTDTEVLAHLIEEFYKGDILQAMAQTAPLLKGAYAVALIHQDHPDAIYCMAHESPLTVGIGDGGAFVASDPNAIGIQAKEVFFLEQGEIAVVRANEHQIFNVSMEPVSKQTSACLHFAEEVSKGDFDHFTIKEIYEQPQSLRAALSSRCAEEYGTAIFDEFHLDMKEFLAVDQVMIIGAGTSLHAGMVGGYLIEDKARIPVHIEVASEFRYKNPVIPSRTLAIAISQSGETADTLAAVRELKAKGCRTLSLCNVVESSLARESDVCLHLRAGPEIGVCSTKAFTNQVVVMTLLSLAMARTRHMSRDQGKVLIEALLKLPDQVQQVLNTAPHIESLARKYHSYDNFFYLGRRHMYPAALEGALKVKEIAYVNANGYPGGELKHGPIALIHEKCPTVALLANKTTLEKMLSNLMEVKARKGPILALAEEGAEGVEEVADDIIWVPQTFDALAIIPTSVALQLFAYYVAHARGTDIDQPRNLAKSVTVE